MKTGIKNIPPHVDIDVAAMSDDSLREIIGEEMFSILEKNGCIQRMKDITPSTIPTSSTTSANNTNTSSNKSQFHNSSTSDRSVNKRDYSSISSNNSNHCKYTSNTNTASTNTNNSISSINWLEQSKKRRIKLRRQACDIITDYAILKAETDFGSYIIDARWFGSVGTFMIHLLLMLILL